MAKRGLGKGLGAFFWEEVTTTKENAAEKVSRSERKGPDGKSGHHEKYGKRWNGEKDGQQSTSKDGHEC